MIQRRNASISSLRVRNEGEGDVHINMYLEKVPPYLISNWSGAFCWMIDSGVEAGRNGNGRIWLSFGISGVNEFGSLLKRKQRSVWFVLSSN